MGSPSLEMTGSSMSLVWILILSYFLTCTTAEHNKNHHKKHNKASKDIELEKLDEGKEEDEALLSRKPKKIGTICDEELDMDNFDKDDQDGLDLTVAESEEISSETRFSSENLLSPVFPILPDGPAVTKGCGNPVCVVVDKRPMRFQSMCDMALYMQSNNRMSQMNYVQKGDCYSIIR